MLQIAEKLVGFSLATNNQKEPTGSWSHLCYEYRSSTAPITQSISELPANMFDEFDMHWIEVYKISKFCRCSYLRQNLQSGTSVLSTGA
jgi:hypothetical protein